MRRAVGRSGNLILVADAAVIAALAGGPPLLIARFAPNLEVPVAVGAAAVGIMGGFLYRPILAPRTADALGRFMLWSSACMGCIIMAAVLCFLHGWTQVGVGLMFASGGASRAAAQTLRQQAQAGRFGSVQGAEAFITDELYGKPSPLWTAPERMPGQYKGAPCLVHPVKARLLKSAAISGCLAVAMTAAVAFIVMTTSPFAPVHSSFSATTGGLLFVVMAVCLLIPLCTLWCLLVLYRLLRPGVSLSITPDGILDNCSLFATGVGLIRWDNLAAVNPIGHSRFAPDSAVRIAVRDPSAPLAGCPWQVRLLRRIFLAVTRVETDLYVPLFMIDAYRAGDLVSVIRKAYDARRARDRHLAALAPAHIIT